MSRWIRRYEDAAWIVHLADRDAYKSRQALCARDLAGARELAGTKPGVPMVRACPDCSRELAGCAHGPTELAAYTEQRLTEQAVADALIEAAPVIFALEKAARTVAETTEAIRYERGEDGPIAVAAWLVAPADMEALRAALEGRR